MNRQFRQAIRGRYDNQTQASKDLGISTSPLSQIIHGRPPTEFELRRLSARFTDAELRKFFGKAIEALLEKIIADANAVVANVQKAKAHKGKRSKKLEGKKAVGE
jgi:hypothetical protein